MDTNARLVLQAQREGLTALHGDALQVNPNDLPVLQGTGNLLALTDNAELNELICQRWAEWLGQDFVFQWSGKEAVPAERKLTGQAVFSGILRPSVISAELQQNEARLRVVRPELGKRDLPGKALIWLWGDQVRFVPPDPTENNPVDRMLVLSDWAGLWDRSLRLEACRVIQSQSLEGV